MHYYQYNAEDLAADDYFKEWVCAPTPATERFWQDFLTDYPERYYQVEEARRLVVGLQEVPRVAVSDEQVHQLWERIEGSLERAKVPRLGRWPGRAWLAAASLVLLLGLGWWWQVPSVPPLAAESTPSSADWTEAVNNAGQPLEVQLTDGSRVLLEKNSRLRYPRAFAGTCRTVYLTGEAFFDVQKNPQKPFLVYANGLVTKVLGTSFRIQARSQDPDVTVVVKSGRVSVYADKPSPTQDPEAHGLVLTPNQKAVFQREQATISKSLVEKPSLLIPSRPLRLFVFEDATAAQVFEALEKAYGIRVVFDEEVMKNCRLTLNLSDEDLYQKLEVICKVLEAKYKLIDGQIILYSHGCDT
ncbi:ferric-dicitrate binding protein FerR (iron transport regulator) [Rhabdobacter roseus]|uniref:Ferric-dicitrate binding protein FerR (Iron transport regulator) n=1 Tax=Rhabdobacter roseus TaxID=1655419 RepID=A0A840U003_9BACT|nr:FecR family protein [Rhabdobacter roseus]MBB5287222.1 ferric-dicitrate binding protein FerR (iron transport regulator) [Rhabdobacter roseus]